MFLVWVRTVFSDTIELAGDVRTVQVGSEQPEHVELALAQRLDQVAGLAGGLSSAVPKAASSRRT